MAPDEEIDHDEELKLQRIYLRSKFSTAMDLNRYSEKEISILTKYGSWLEGLASGYLTPITPQQEQFKKVVKGELEPSTNFEHLWMRYQKDYETWIRCEVRKIQNRPKYKHCNYYELKLLVELGKHKSEF